MRKETRKEERVVTSNYTVYIADDGKEFDDERKCKEYEKKCKLRVIEPKFEAMKIKELNGIAPLTENEEFPERDFWWFNLNTEEDYDLIVNYYDALNYDLDYMGEPDTYPTTVCVMESDSYVETVYLNDIMTMTKWFFGKFGYKVDIKKKGE